MVLEVSSGSGDVPRISRCIRDDEEDPRLSVGMEAPLQPLAQSTAPLRTLWDWEDVGTFL